MPHCHRGGGGGGGFGGISSVRRSWTVWELWLLCIHGWNMKKKGEKKKKKGGFCRFTYPRNNPACTQSVSKKEKIGFVILIFLLLFVRWGRDTCSSCTCCLHWTPFVLQMEPKGKPTNMLPPTTTTSFPLPLPRFLLSEQRNTDEGRGCHEL